MNIAVVCPYDLGRVGGVQDQAQKLVSWLGDAGHEAWLVGPGSDGPPGARLVGPVTVVTANGAATPITLSPSAWRQTADAIAEADVVHVHEPFMPIVSPAAIALSRTPTVGTFHADPSRVVRRLYRVAGPALRRISGRLAVATAVSPVAAAPLDGLVSVRLVPNGIDVDTFRSNEKNSLRVAFLGRDDPRKGLATLLAAWHGVYQAVPGAELVVAGVGPEKGNYQGVTFVGGVDEAQKRSILANAAIFCAPNTGGESFGLVVAEAMAAGCAVVASAIPAFVYVAADAAVFTKPSDPADLTAALVALLSDPPRQRQLGGRALRRVDRFDRSAVLAGYLEAYEAALASA